MANPFDSIFNSGQAASNIFQGTQGAPQPPAAPPTQHPTIDQILAGLTRPDTRGENVADIGSILGAFSSGEKANRMSYGDLRQGYDRMMLGNQIAQNNFGLENQQQRNANEGDALRKLQQGAYLEGGGAHYAPPTFMLGGQQRTAPSFSFAPHDATPTEMGAGHDLQTQMVQRLQDPAFHPDNSFQAAPVDSYAKPGVAEQIGSYGALGGGVLGNIMDMLGKGGQQGQQSTGISGLLGQAGGGISKALGGTGNVLGDVGSGLSKLFHVGGSGAASTTSNAASGAGAASGLAGNIAGKVVPGLGAITGGMGLMHDQGTGHNIMNGVGAGASIGSMFAPGIGTGIGAGVGALVGALRGVGGPSQEELAGREMAGSARQSMASGATPAQIQEAGKAGWSKPQDALSLIVMRDKLNAQGAAPDAANQYMDQLFQAEKHGPQAVQQVMNSIAQKLNGGHV